MISNTKVFGFKNLKFLGELLNRIIECDSYLGSGTPITVKIPL